jgi:cell division protein FtsB
MKLLALISILVILYLGYDIYCGRNGIVQYQETVQKFEEASDKSELLERRNQALQDEITDLKQGNRVVEELARSDLGMVKKEETFYRVIDKEEKRKNSK